MALKKGDKVSLNLSKRLFFFQGEEGINLNMNDSTAIIPDSISEKNISMIERAIVLREIVMGSIAEKKFEVPTDKKLDELMQKGRNAIKDFVYDLREDKKISGDKKIIELEKMLQMEKSDKDRISVIKDIEFALSKCAGTSQVSEEEVEKMEIKLTKGTEEEIEEQPE